MATVRAGQAEKYNSNGLVSHLLTPVTAPTGLEGQQSTEFSQLGNCTPPHGAASSTVSKNYMWLHTLTVPTPPIGKDLQTNNCHDTQRDYFCLLQTEPCEILMAEIKMTSGIININLISLLSFFTGLNMPTLYLWKRYLKVNHTSTLSCNCEYSHVWVCAIRLFV